VADVLSPGALLEDASHRNIEIIHADGTRERCDLQLFLQTGEARWNPWLRDGDVVQVPTATRFVHAEGALARPGRFELGQADSVATLVRLAGGLLPAARPDRMLVLRFTGGAQPESLWVATHDVVEGREPLPLEDGDRFFVYFDPLYRQLRQATIVGEVERPGTYPIVEGVSTLRDLVLAAQGLLRTADSTAIRVHRPLPLASGKDPELDRLLRLSRTELTASEYEVLRTRLSGLREDFSVDWRRAAAGGEPDLLLRDGDLVRVDRLLMSIRVDGEVRRPGLINYVRGRSVEQCVESAGGFTNRAWRGKVRVTRAVTGQTLFASNVRELDPGDLIWVPERPDRTVWEQVGTVLVALTQVATIVIAIQSVK
jgi:protein involved in polysaccharide export with SLBB domain